MLFLWEQIQVCLNTVAPLSSENLMHKQQGWLPSATACFLIVLVFSISLESGLWEHIFSHLGFAQTGQLGQPMPCHLTLTLVLSLGACSSLLNTK